MSGPRSKITAAIGFLLVISASAALAQEREWNFDTGEDDAYLVFGVPETDDVGVSFWCTVGSGEIRIFVPEAGEKLIAGAAIKVDIEVRGNRFSLDGTAALNEETKTASAEAHIDSASPLFPALIAADRFSLKIGKEESVFPLQGADFDSLLRVCSRK